MRTGMSFSVANQSWLLRECLAAYVTYKRPLASVDKQMLAQL